VVATGLNRMAARQPTRTETRVETMSRAPVKLVRNATTGMVDMSAMPAMDPAPVRARAEPAGDSSLDYLDIPAFLRRQAD
jgi:cell division protein FtsZ